MDLFEEITKEKEDFPKVHLVTKEVKKYKLNFYQLFSLSIFVLCLFLGIVFGNLFATCETSSFFYSNVCAVKQFNYSLMISIWFIGILIAVILFSIGHIIALLSEINQKLTKFRV